MSTFELVSTSVIVPINSIQVTDSGKVAIVSMEDVYPQPVNVQGMEESVFQEYVSAVMLGMCQSISILILYAN